MNTMISKADRQFGDISFVTPFRPSKICSFGLSRFARSWLLGPSLELLKIPTFNSVIFQLANVSCYQNFQAISNVSLLYFRLGEAVRFSVYLSGIFKQADPRYLDLSIPPPPPPPPPSTFNREELWGVRTFAQISDGTLFCQSDGKRRDEARIIISLPSKEEPIPPRPSRPSRSLPLLVSLLFSVKQTLPSARINFSSASKRHGCSLESSVLFFPVAGLPAKRRSASSGRRKGRRGWDHAMIAL